MYSRIFSRHLLHAAAACLAVVLAPAVAAAEGWTNWRGPNQDGTSLEGDLPDSWELNGTNHLWDIPLPSCGAPVIDSGRLYALGFEGEGKDLQEVVTCIDAETGKRIWTRGFSDFISDTVYNRYSVGSPTIDTETGRIFVNTTPGLLMCLEKDGSTVWERSLMEEFGRLTFPNSRTGAPVLDGDRVIVHGITANWGGEGPASDRFYAFDKNTGELIWSSTPGVSPQDSSYSTPILADTADGLRVFYAGTGCGNLVCVNARTGAPLWRFQMTSGGVNTTVLDAGDRIVVTHGKENIDTTEIGRMIAVKKGARPGPNGAEVVLGADSELWRANICMFTSSPCLVGRRAYQTGLTGELFCVDIDSGKILWNKKLGPDQIHASPLYGDGKLYVPLHGATEDQVFSGLFYILRPSDTGAEVLSKVKLEGACLGTPAAWNGKIYLQTTARLYCFGRAGGTPRLIGDVKKLATPTPGAAAELQVIPAEVLLEPGQRQPMRLLSLDSKGVVVSQADSAAATWEHWIPPTAKVKVNLDATVVDGAMVAGAANKTSAGAFKATAGGFSGTMRGRVLPAMPITEDFNDFAVTIPSTTNPGTNFAWPPLPWIGARFKWEVREVDGEKVLAKTLDRLLFQRTMTFIGSPDLKDYTIEADVMSDGNRRIMSSVGLINQRYIVSLVGNWQQIEVSSNQDRIKEAAPFAWQPGAWYRLKMRVDVQPDGSGMIRGKAWPRAEAEPAAWNIEVAHQHAHPRGAPGLFGFSPQSQKSVYIDNIRVYPNTH